MLHGPVVLSLVAGCYVLTNIEPLSPVACFHNTSLAQVGKINGLCSSSCLTGSRIRAQMKHGNPVILLL